MTQKVYFHAPKCTFNPNLIWDQKWNYMDSGLDINFHKICFQNLSYKMYLVKLLFRRLSISSERKIKSISLEGFIWEGLMQENQTHKEKFIELSTSFHHGASTCPLPCKISILDYKLIQTTKLVCTFFFFI